MGFLNMTCFILHFYDLYTIIYVKYDISIYDKLVVWAASVFLRKQL